ncbi:unnamed protein product [Moneuplotes crassus]|uniref:Uncharacterized protein n=1 Tax=Euplotes crassus TaxID=5936 RepID=A0AAD1U9B7_EUPCR|nr:unnamed protein product [Moneuplotes crassus]
MDPFNAIPQKLQCSDPACKKHRVYFCKSHQMQTCKSCANKMHFKCQLDIIHDLTDLKIDVIEVKRFVKRLFELIAENGLRRYSPNIDSELKDFKDSLVEIENKIKDAITHDHFEQFDTLQSEIKQVQTQMDDSKVVKDILYLSTFRDVSMYSLPKIGGDLSSATKVKEKIDAVVKENVELMEKKFSSKSRQFEQQCKDRLTEEFKDEIQNLKHMNDAKDTELEEQKEATEQALQDTEDTKKQRDEALAENATLQAENKDLKDFKAQLEEDLKAKLDQIEESKNQHAKDQDEISKLCEELKENIGQLEETKEMLTNQLKGICKDFDPDSKDLTLNMTKDKCQKLVKTLGDFKYHLGDMDKLKIDNVDNEDAALKKFLTNSSLASLKSLVFNVDYKGSGDEETGVVKVKFYLDGLKKVLPQVTKEVYLTKLIADSDDLSQIVKLSYNAERLTVRLSKILTSNSLDFASPTPSKISYLSFKNCGRYDWSNQEWDKHPDKFEKIVTAIKNSSLKDSLETLNLRNCKISISKATSLLSTHGLSHISIIQEDNTPISL